LAAADAGSDLSHEALDSNPIGVAANDVEPGTSKRMRDAHSHRTEADHRRPAHNSSFHCSHQLRLEIALGVPG
jgi:hypothetical protein